MRIMSRPAVDFNPEVFVSENVRHAFQATGRDLMYSDVPNAAVNLYQYNGGSFDRDLVNSIGYAEVFQDLNRAIFVFTRLRDDPMLESVLDRLNFGVAVTQVEQNWPNKILFLRMGSIARRMNPAPLKGFVTFVT